MLTSVYASPFAAGRGVLDFMKFAPLLKVGEQNISILGRSASVILINGRKTNYRAEQQQGVVNIIMKKSENEGVKATIKVSDNQQYYNGQSLTGALSYNSKKLVLTAGVNFSHSPLYLESHDMGTYLSSNQLVNVYDKASYTTLRLGGNINMDYLINKRSTIGVSVKASFNDKRNSSNSTTRISNTHGCGAKNGKQSLAFEWKQLIPKQIKSPLTRLYKF